MVETIPSPIENSINHHTNTKKVFISKLSPTTKRSIETPQNLLNQNPSLDLT